MAEDVGWLQPHMRKCYRYNNVAQHQYTHIIYYCTGVSDGDYYHKMLQMKARNVTEDINRGH